MGVVESGIVCLKGGGEGGGGETEIIAGFWWVERWFGAEAETEGVDDKEVV